MSIIHYSIAFKALDNYIKNHNKKNLALSDKIRQSIASTAKDLIGIYGLSLLKANSIAPIDTDNLPSLRINNAQLASMGNASTRTIQRHIKRLIDAKIITKKIWHGSNSSYELWLHPNILLISGLKAVNKAKNAEESHDSQQTKNQLFKKNTTTKCLHTDTSNNSYINNIIIQVDNLKSNMSSLPLTALSKSRNATGNHFTGDTEEKSAKKIDDAEGKVRDKRATIQTDDEKSSTNLVRPPFLKIDGQALSKSRNATANHFTGDTEEKSAKKIDDAEGKVRDKRATIQTGDEKSSTDLARPPFLKPYVEALWKLSRNTIYKDHYLTKSQIKKANELLYLWYETVPENKIANVHQCYVDRIEIVQKYIAKDPKNRFVQLPNTYFDPQNKYGFTGTRSWYFKQREQKEKLQYKLIVKAQIRSFLNNEKKDTSKQKPRLEFFRKCETRISKLGKPELLQEFHASILSHSSHQFIYNSK